MPIQRMTYEDLLGEDRKAKAPPGVSPIGLEELFGPKPMPLEQDPDFLLGESLGEPEEYPEINLPLVPGFPALSVTAKQVERGAKGFIEVMKRFAGNAEQPINPVYFKVLPSLVNTPIDELPAELQQPFMVPMSFWGGAVGAQPVDKDLFDWAASRTDVPADAQDFLNRVVPTSLAKTIAGITHFFVLGLPGDAVSPFIQAWKQEYDLATRESLNDDILMSSMGLPTASLKPMNSVEEALARAVYKNAVGLARFSGEQIGLFGWEDFKRRWLTDPVGAIVGLLPILRAARVGYAKAAETGQAIPAVRPDLGPVDFGEVRGTRPQPVDLPKIYTKLRDDAHARYFVKDVPEKSEAARAELRREYFRVEEGGKVQYHRSSDGTTYKSKTGTPWKNKAATQLTRQAILRQDGVETVPVQLGERGPWILREREAAVELGEVEAGQKAGVAAEPEVDLLSREDLIVEGLREEAEAVKTETAEERVEAAMAEEEPGPTEVKVETDERIREAMEAPDLEEEIAAELSPEEAEARLRPEVLEDWDFYEDKKTTDRNAAEFASRQKSVESDVELYTMKLVNDVNQWLHGNEGIDITQVRNDLSSIAALADQMRMHFLDGEHHFAFKLLSQEAAEYARVASRTRETRVSEGVVRRPTGETLYAGMPVDLLREKMKRLIRRYRALATTTGGKFEEFAKPLLADLQAIVDTAEYPISQDHVSRIERMVLEMESGYREAGPVPKEAVRRESLKAGDLVNVRPVRVLDWEFYGVSERTLNEVELTGKGPNFAAVKKQARQKYGSKAAKDFERAYNYLMGLEEVDIGVGKNKVLAEVYAYEYMLLKHGDRPYKLYSGLPADELRNSLATIWDKLVKTEAPDEKINIVRDAMWAVNKADLRLMHPARAALEKAGYTKEARMMEKAIRQVGELGAERFKAEILEATRRQKKGVTIHGGLPADELSKYFDKIRAAGKAPLSVRAEKTKDVVKEMFLDTGAKVRTELYKLAKQGSPEALDAAYKYNLTRGANTLGGRIFKQYEREIYRKLDKNQERALDEIIAARRYRTTTAPDYPRRRKHPEGITHESSSGFLQPEYLQRRFGLNEAQVAGLEARADAYFEVAREQLAALRDEGIITQELYDKLEKFDYSRRQLIESIDPKLEAYDPFRRKKMTVQDSGIEYLQVGKEGELYEINSRMLLADLVMRTQSRILQNRANKALYNLASQVSDNPVVRRWKKDATPRGWTDIEMFIEGEKKKVIMPTELANAWLIRKHEISHRMSRMLRILSGSFILRPMATGLNVGFALTNFPRDIMHIWLASDIMRKSGEGMKWESTYSPHLPVFAAQMTRDLAAVASDAWLRKGRWDDYVREGGGMEFMTHQGKHFKRETPIDKSFDSVYQVLGYLGESSEIWTRLALRERAIRRGASPIEASAIARDYLDFGQGGSVTKAMDTAFPYLNAAIQGTRGVFRSAIRRPKQFGMQVGWLTATAIGIHLANKYQNKEAYESINPHVRDRYWIFTTPFSYTDELGNKQYVYYKIAKDQGQIFFARAAEAIADKLTGEEIDVDAVVNSLKEMSPVDLGSLPPTGQAIVGYLTNKDFWLNEDIWRGPEVESSQEFTTHTHPGLVAAGEATGLSPERLGYAMSRLFTQGNIYTWAVGQGWKQVFGGLPYEQQETAIALTLAKTPLFKRVVGIASPAGRFRQELDEIEQQGNTTRFVQNRGMDVLAEEVFAGRATRDDIRQYIKEHKDSSDQERLLDRFQNHIKVRNIPSPARNYLVSMMHLAPEQRAEYFYKIWTSASEEDKTQIRRGMGLLRGHFSPKTEGGKRFWARYSELQQQAP